MNKWMIIPALAGAVVLGGAALANGLGTSEVHAAENFISLKEAKALAVKKVGGKVTEIELEKTKNGYIYEVEVDSKGIEYDLDIDAQTGKVVIEKQQAKKVVKAEQPKVAGTKLLTKEQAISIATKKAKGIVTKAKLDDDDGRKHYDIEIKDGTYEYDFEIDAITGEILEFDKERDNKKVNNQETATNKTQKLLTKDQAIAIAMKKAKGTVTKAKLDDDDGRKHYDIEIKDGTYEYDFEIDAITGKILEFDKERDDDRKKVNNQATATNKTQKLLTKDQAIAIAMKQAKGKVTDLDLDDDDGRLIYEIEIKDGKYDYEFEIDAVSGKVLKFEKDRDDNDDDDDDDNDDD